MGMKGRICFVLQWHPNDASGGAEIQAWLLARELAARGWQVHYVSEWPGSSSSRPSVLEAVNLHGLPCRRPEFALLNYPRLRRLMMDIAADIHYQRVAGPYTGMVAALSRALNSRCVWAAASVTDCTGISVVSRWRWYMRIGWRGAARLPFVLLNDAAFAAGVRWADQIVAQSVEQRKMIQHARHRPATIVPNGHPVPPCCGPKASPPIVAWVATINTRKQPQLFVELAAACRHLDARFVMAGRPAEPALAHQVMRSAAEVPNLTYLGGISLEQVNQLLARASLFVNTSAYEGFPNSFIQAWLRATPTLSLNVDPDGVIEHHGLGIHASNLQGLISSVQRLLADHGEREAMGLRARNYAAREHSLSAMVDRYEAAFTALLERQPEHGHETR